MQEADAACRAAIYVRLSVEDTHTHSAVSYTHLDVYKRQGLHHAHYPGRVANRMDLLKWTSRAAAPVFAIMLCGFNSARAAASQSQIPCTDGSLSVHSCDLEKTHQTEKGDCHDAADTERIPRPHG